LAGRRRQASMKTSSDGGQKTDDRGQILLRVILAHDILAHVSFAHESLCKESYICAAYQPSVAQLRRPVNLPI